MNKYKKDFPIFQNRQAVMPLIYLDSAATSQKPQVVIDAVVEYYQTYNANIHRGVYAIAEKATEKVEEVRKKVAKFINANDSSEIVFTHGTTEAINLIAASLCKRPRKGRGILLSEMEHHSNLVPWQHYARVAGMPVGYLAFDGKSGKLTGEIVSEGRNKKNTDINNYSIISLTHVSNVLGTVNDVAHFAKNIRDNEETSVLIIDAAQSVPHMKVDVQDLGCDFLAFSGHKMFSPSGIGILWGRKNILNTLDPLLFGSQMIKEVTLHHVTYQDSPERFESGTLPIEGIIGFGAAIDYLSEIGMNTIRTHEKNLIGYTLEQLRKISGLTTYGPKNINEHSGVISFNLDGVHPHDVAQILGQSNICVRAGHHCAMPLHKKLGVPATVRVSLNIYNDDEDIDALIRGLKEVKKVFSIH
ncbi:MAG: SufS family cysteine desulfurase [bacterium]|nr:SufS family cysteine desulfurase [bacterium]